MIGLLHKNNEQKYSLNIVFTFSFCISFRCMFLYCFLPVSFFPLAFILCPTPGCRAYRDPGVRRAETRMSDMSRPGCHAMPFRISVFSFRLPLFLSARIRIYYNVSLLPGFSSSLKNMFFNTIVNQRFIKMFKENAKKSPYIFGLYVIKSYFCTRFREREQRCIDILTGTAQELLPISSAWGLFLSEIPL